MMIERCTFKLAAVSSALAIAGCSTNLQTEPAPRRPIAQPRVVHSIAVSPSDYIAAAASASLFAIRASELIATSEGNSALGQFASRVKTQHDGIGSQLSFAGRRLDLLPSATLLPRHRAMLDDISSSGDARAAYLRYLRTVLPQTLALHRSYEQYGTSPTLRPVASVAAPMIAQEVDALDRF